jgi:hypothetical protein
MHKPDQIAILSALAALPGGVALMAAPEAFPFLKAYPLPFFWGSFGLTAVLLGAAIIIAFRSEAMEQRRGHKRRMIALSGMIVCGLGFLGFFAAYFWPATQGTLSASPASPPPHLAPVHQETASLTEAPPPIPERESVARAALISKMRDKYPDRIIADVTPDYLLDLYKDRMTILGDRDVQSFIGKWFILSGKIADVSAVGPSAKIGI